MRVKSVFLMTLCLAAAFGAYFFPASEAQAQRQGYQCHHIKMSDLQTYHSLISGQTSDNAKVEIALSLAQTGNCISVAQIARILALFENDSDKMTVALALHPATADPQNWNLLRNVFANRSEWAKVAEKTNSTENHAAKQSGTCPVIPANDFSPFYFMILKNASDSDKFEMVKSFAHTGSCLVVGQVISLLHLFENDSDKVAVALALHPSAADPQNWILLKYAFANRSDWAKVVKKTGITENAIAVAQSDKCRSMPVSDFNAYYKTMSKLTSDNDKAEMAMILARMGSCFSVNQIVKVINLLKDDDKVAAAPAFYPATADPQNWPLLKHAFVSDSDWSKVMEITSQSEAFQNAMKNAEASRNAAKNAEPSRNAMKNAGASQRAAKKGGNDVGKNVQCRAMPAKDFRDYYSTMSKEASDKVKVDMAQSIVHTDTCLSVTQIIRILSLFEIESDKATVAVVLHPLAADKENWIFLKHAFRSDWPKVAEKTNTMETGGDQDELCRTLPFSLFSTYHSMMLTKETSDSDKTEMFTSIARTGTCFTTAQITKILELFKSESDKAAVAIALYSATVDPQNWILLKHAFTSGSSWAEVLKKTGATGSGVSDRHQSEQCRAMNTGDFAIYRSVMSKKSSERDKVEMAQSIAHAGNCLTVTQIAQMLKIFEYNSDKATVAVALYPITVDPKNWAKLQQNFGSSPLWSEVVEKTTAQ